MRKRKRNSPSYKRIRRSHHLRKKSLVSRKLQAYRSFQLPHPNIYEKCRHFRRG